MIKRQPDTPAISGPDYIVTKFTKHDQYIVYNRDGKKVAEGRLHLADDLIRRLNDQGYRVTVATHDS